jgi:hypothetical protein
MLVLPENTLQISTIWIGQQPLLSYERPYTVIICKARMDLRERFATMFPAELAQGRAAKEDT